MADKKILFEIFLENGEFKTRAKEADDSLDNLGKRSKETKGMFTKLKESWVATTLAIGALVMGFKTVVSIFADTVRAASKLQETQNKFDVVFKNSKVQAESFAKTLQDSYGMAKEEAMSFLAGTGDILSGLGMQSDKALELSNAVAILGTDLASFSNVEGGAERAINALSSALTGEREALKAYGIVINEEMIKAELVAQGKSKLTGLSLTQAKAEATIALAYKQSENAVGDMARSFDSYANVQRRVESAIEDQKSAIGDDLIPSLSNLGIAFISASKDGGLLSSALHAVTKYIAGTIDGVALLIAKLDQMKSSNASDKLMKDSAEVTKNFSKTRDDVYASWGGIEKFNKAVKEGNYTAKKQNEELEIGKKHALAKNKLVQISIEEEKKKVNVLANLQNRIAEGDKLASDQKDKISNREKARKKETNTTTSGGDKIKEADMGAYYASIGDVSGQQKVAMEKEIANVQAAYNQKKISHEEFESAKNAITEKYQKQAMDAFQKDLEDKMGKYQKFTGGFTQLSGQLSQIISMSASNQTANVDNEATAQMDKINARYQAEIDAVNNSSATEEEKNAKLKAIDEKKAREEKAIQDAAAKEKKKIAREAAEMQKKIAIFETTIEIPTAAFQAYSSAQVLPFPASAIVGGAMATAATVLGLAKLKMIQQQPLPAYAAGTWAVPYDMTAQIHQGEKIIPKTFAQSIDSGEITIGKGGGANGNTIIVQGSIIDAQGLLNIVDDLQEGRAKNMGASKYTTKSPY